MNCEVLCSIIDIHIYECTGQVLVLNRLHYARLHYDQLDCHGRETYASYSTSHLFPVVPLCGVQDLNLLFTKSEKLYHKYIDSLIFTTELTLPKVCFIEPQLLW